MEALQAAHINVDVFAFRGKMNPLNYARAWLKCQHQIWTKEYDILHAQFGQSGLLVLPKRLPLVVSFRGSDLLGDLGTDLQSRLAGFTLQTISRVVAYFADEVIVMSQELANLIDKPCKVIPSGVDLNLFTPQARDKARDFLGLPLDKKLVLFAANPDNPIKRYSLACEVIRLVKAHLPVELLVAYNVPHHKMPYYMNACDVLLLASSHEGSPNVVKEALACNLPVVSVDVGDARFLLEKIKGCIVCTNDLPATIADSLSYVLQNVERVQGRQAIKHLSQDMVTQEVIRVYRRCLDHVYNSDLRSSR